ncbi:MAG: acetyl-CoA carboxylase biotin carboxyl carrier protein [Ectothiorhodospiraceae bacterium AqS1]|nr:acetyl-CoA carboxylase biotin carboxyl carrier protein [Ectothiorhodospiraceae bacterium AqS1]
MDIRKIKNLIELVEESGIDEIEIREGDGQIRITRRRENPNPPLAPIAPLPPTFVAAAEAPKPAPAASTTASDPEAPASPAPEADGLPDGHVVTSPMVGTFYGSASPGDPPFVSVGKRIEPGDTLCIIEAMKILNQIESEVKGEVVAVVAENGHPVEYGQPLFVIAAD